MNLTEKQQKLINSNSKIILCNWDRRTGKSTGIIEKILKDKNNYIFISNAKFGKNNLIYQALKNHRDYGKFLITNKDKNHICLAFRDEKNVSILEFKSLKEIEEHTRLHLENRTVIIDDIELLNLESIGKVFSSRYNQLIITTSTDKLEVVN